MKFNLKQPCANCPFRSDRPEQRGWLGYDRAKEIAPSQQKTNIPVFATIEEMAEFHRN